jgi:hypothetical protein
MEGKQREEVALFRFGVISDLVGATRLEHGEFGRLIREKSRQRWNIPYSHLLQFKKNSLTISAQYGMQKKCWHYVHD